MKIINNRVTDFVALTAILALYTWLVWPLLFIGYGTDIDSWSVANAAREMQQQGMYIASRKPGFPYHELLVAAVNGATPFLSNFLSLVATLVSSIILYTLILKHGRSKALIGSIFFLSVPMVTEVSTQTLDHSFGIMWLFLSFFFFTRKKLLYAGIAIGFATGFRISSCIILLPYAIQLFSSKDQDGIKSFFLLTFPALLIGFVPFLLPYLTEGVGFFQSPLNPGLAFSFLIELLLSGTFGGLVWISLLIGLIFNLIQKNQISRDPDAQLPLLIGIQFLLIFILLPFDQNYAVFSVPFLLLWFTHFFSLRILLILCVISCMSLFIPFSNYFSQGLTIAQQKKKREFILAEGKRIAESITKLEPNAHIAVGSWLPIVLHYLPEAHYRYRLIFFLQCESPKATNRYYYSKIRTNHKIFGRCDPDSFSSPLPIRYDK